MNILSEKDGAPFVWSSSVPFGEDKIGEVTEKLKGLFTSIDKIYRDQSIERPEIHIQHYKPAKSVTYYISPNKSFDQIGLRANFQKLFSNTDEFLFQILLEILRMESKSWVIQDRALIYWRGYAAYRAGLKKTPLSEYSVFESFPEIKESLHDRAWLRVYFALGPCLFNRLSRNLFPDVKENRDSIDESKFARHKINIDSQTNTIQFLRSNLAGPSRLGSYIENKIDELEMSDGKRLIHRPEFDVSMDEIFPKVYKMKYTQKNYDQKQSSRIEIVDVDKTGWAFFEKSIQFGMDKFSMAPDFLTTQGDKRFTTISWFNEALGCRVYGRWRSLTGE